ncbi:hypothetical protein AKUH3B101J_09090 [Apilactobacillus kunkeei]|nr:hypothetical protein AKUH3B104J_09090 [Apilactobacillus kunkeei]CAI2615991.1 hypothetical protein AKUH3B101J_09090 [Apilactobacillus kunkeei]
MNQYNELLKINKKKQFLINQFGEKKLIELITALDIFCEEKSVKYYELNDLTSFYQSIASLHEYRH